MPTWIFFLCQISVIAYALVGGVFLAFSDFIMRSLTNTAAPGGIEAMQVINREVFKFVFMASFLGMAVLSFGLALYAYLYLEGSAGLYIIFASAVYLVGVFGVTVAFNVPLNNLLDGMDVHSADTREFWTRRYVPNWTFWNSIRTAASVIAAGTLLLAITSMPTM